MWKRGLSNNFATNRDVFHFNIDLADETPTAIYNN